MSVERIASRYAKSLVELAVDQGVVDAVKADMDLLRDSFRNEDLMHLIKSPIIHPSKKVEIFKELFGQRVNPLTLTFIEVLATKGRERFLPEVVESFMAQFRQKMGIISAKLVTAVPADEVIINFAKEKIKDVHPDARKVEIENAVNPDLLGGFQLEFDGKIYDDSVVGHLNKIRQNLRK